MFINPNTYVTVTRGETRNEFGSLQPDTTPVAEHVPILIATIISTRTIRVASEELGRSYVVTDVYGTVEQGTDIQVNDRLHDEYTGGVYEVQAVVAPMSALGWNTLPTHLVLRTLVT